MSSAESPTSGTTKPTIFVQEACLRHQYIRSKDASLIVERPERLRAVNIGVSAALSRLESLKDNNKSNRPEETAADDLVAALDNLKIDSTLNRLGGSKDLPATIHKSVASVDLLNNSAVKFVHGDIEGDAYLENLVRWAKQSRDVVAKGESEIPSNSPQGDLYLCPGSLDAIQGAVGTVCEAVDTVVSSPSHRAFVAIRPPGHHCGEDTPSGFCFVNNVTVAAAHAHLKHHINRVVVFDIDLHHGNGTQALAWQINEETYRQKLEQESGAPSSNPGLQVYYGSIHDVLSYPCEDGKMELIQAASVSIHGPHGQHIENIHLQPYTSDTHFWEELYEKKYKQILLKAEAFLEQTGGAGEDVLAFISCGFDASEHEYESMSRHGRNVPTSFYHRFALDARRLADKFSRGRIISVLEGGYSDRALTSGTMAHIIGLTQDLRLPIDESWWNLENLTQLEQATKKRRGGRPSQTNTPFPPWLQRTLEIFSTIDSAPPVNRPVVPPSTMSLRARQKAGPPGDVGGQANNKEKPAERKDAGGSRGTASAEKPKSSVSDTKSEGSGDDIPKKLPRVILKLGPDPREPIGP